MRTRQVGRWVAGFTIAAALALGAVVAGGYCTATDITWTVGVTSSTAAR